MSVFFRHLLLRKIKIEDNQRNHRGLWSTAAGLQKIAGTGGTGKQSDLRIYSSFCTGKQNIFAALVNCREQILEYNKIALSTVIVIE